MEKAQDSEWVSHTFIFYLIFILSHLYLYLGNQSKFLSAMAASSSSTTRESQVHQKPKDQPLPKMILATRAGNLRSLETKIVLKSPDSSKTGRGLGTFPAESSTTVKPTCPPACPPEPLRRRKPWRRRNHRLRPPSPRNPLLCAEAYQAKEHSPPSPPVQGRLESPPAKSKFLAA